jgi:hypothetical protein
MIQYNMPVFGQGSEYINTWRGHPDADSVFVDGLGLRLWCLTPLSTLFQLVGLLVEETGVRKLLTSGNPILSNEQNEIIFKHVFEYIKRSERFLV